MNFVEAARSALHRELLEPLPYSAQLGRELIYGDLLQRRPALQARMYGWPMHNERL